MKSPWNWEWYLVETVARIWKSIVYSAGSFSYQIEMFACIELSEMWIFDLLVSLVMFDSIAEI